MKLVDILARELKGWPETCTCGYCCQSDETTEVFFGHPAGNVFLSERADETEGVTVTRAQWQAAVDALKASESAIPAPSDQAIEAWLVGLEIPYGLEAAQACREIINNHKRKRDEAIEIQKIRDEIKWQKPQLGPCPVEQMYLLGYRKFEIVDN